MSRKTERIRKFEIRRIDGEIDEIVGPGFHLEFMDDNHVWIGFHRKRKPRDFHIDIFREGKRIKCNAEMR